MIRLANCLAELEQAAINDPIGGAPITALFKCYNGYPFIDFYVWEHGGKIIGSFCRYDGALTACCNTDEVDDAAAFLLAIGGFAAADLPLNLGLALERAVEGKLEQAIIMQANELLCKRADICTSAGVIYDINESADAFKGGRVPWIADFSHRLRHGTAKAFILSQQGEPAACAAITHIGSTHAIIGCIATMPQHRGMGLGQMCAAAAITEVQSLGLIPLLCCNPQLQGFYAKLGCAPIGKRTNLYINN